MVASSEVAIKRLLHESLKNYNNNDYRKLLYQFCYWFELVIKFEEEMSPNYQTKSVYTQTEAGGSCQILFRRMEVRDCLLEALAVAACCEQL